MLCSAENLLTAEMVYLHFKRMALDTFLHSLWLIRLYIILVYIFAQEHSK